jgi:hydrogenase-4 component B
MSASLLLFAWLLPLVLALLPSRLIAARVLSIGTLPAFAAALATAPGQRLDLGWLLLGTELAMDTAGQWFLLASALIWLLAAVQRRWIPDSPRSEVLARRLFLTAMAGNFLLVLAAEALTFYLGYALMGLSAYGLIIGRRSQRARHAGRVYLAWTLAGELALFLALVLSAVEAGSLRFADLASVKLPAAAVALLLFGFGIKLALPGLHFWMPLAYGAAPASAAALLAGPMFNAGLLGLLRFLPPGQPGLAEWSVPVLAAGVLALAYGTLAGLATNRARRVLGYSSMLKSGTLLIVLALAWRHPEAAPLLLAALLPFAMHHLLIKSGLFLGLGLWERGGRGPLVSAGLLMLALGLVGAPLTAGAVLKQDLAAALPEPIWGWLLSAAALGGVLLMWRLYRLLSPVRSGPQPLATTAPAAWWLLVLGSLWLPGGFGDGASHLDALPVLLAGLLLAGIGRLVGRNLAWPKSSGPRRRLSLPEPVMYVVGRFALRRSAPVWLPLSAGLPILAPAPAVGLALAGLSWLALLLLLLLTLVDFR